MRLYSRNKLFFVFTLVFAFYISPSSIIANSTLKYKVRVIAIHANNSGNGIDSGLEDIIPTDKRPFSSYNSFKILHKFKKKLKFKRTILFFIEDGSMLGIKVNDLKKDETPEFDMTIFYSREKNKEHVKILEDEFVLVGGQSYNDGMIFYYIRVY